MLGHRSAHQKTKNHTWTRQSEGMSTTILEKTRAAHEDIELFEKAALEAMLEDPKSVRYLF